MDAMEQRARARYEAETDPVQREAYALAKRGGFDWYNTESAARRMAEHAAEELVAARTKDEAYEKMLKALQQIVAESNQFNADRNGYAIHLEAIAREGLPGNGQ